MKSYRTMCKKTWAVILAIACHLPATWATNAAATLSAPSVQRQTAAWSGMDRPRRNDIRCSQSPVARHDAGRGSLFLRQRVREKIHRHDGHVQVKQTAIPLD